MLTFRGTGSPGPRILPTQLLQISPSPNQHLTQVPGRSRAPRRKLADQEQRDGTGLYVVDHRASPYLAQWLSISTQCRHNLRQRESVCKPDGASFGGGYSGTIVVTAPGAAASPYSLPVTLEVSDAPSTLISSAATLTFTYMTGGAAPAPQPLC